MQRMNEIKVSVIVPIYNAEKYLSECIESILLQTYKNIEIICVDDGSTDKSAEIIRHYQERDKRIRLIQQTNQYAGAARNHGFDVAEGEYVVFLDADDYFGHSLVEKMASVMYKKNVDIVICESQGFDEKAKKEHKLSGALDLEILPEKEVFSREDIPEQIFQLTAGWAWDKMYRTKFIREKHLRFQEIRAAEDELFVDLAYGEARSIAVVKEILVTHRTNVESSLEYRKDQLWHCGYEMLAAEKYELEKRGFFPALEKSFVNRAAKYITWNACSITTPACFSEFYKFFQENAIKEFGLLNYPKEYYYDLFAYEILGRIGKCSEKEFLCKRVRELNNTVADRDLYVQELLSDAEWLIECIQRKRWPFPDSLVPKGARVILYGFGDVGNDWYEEIQRVGNVELALVVDRDYKKYQGGAVEIHSPEDIMTEEYDYILIAINERRTADAVKSFLIKLGVLSEKILWFDLAERA